MKRQGSGQRALAVLRSRFECRRGEIKGASPIGANAIADPNVATDPAYAEGLRAAVEAAIESVDGREA